VRGSHTLIRCRGRVRVVSAEQPPAVAKHHVNRAERPWMWTAWLSATSTCSTLRAG